MDRRGFLERFGFSAAALTIGFSGSEVTAKPTDDFQVPLDQYGPPVEKQQLGQKLIPGQFAEFKNLDLHYLIASTLSFKSKLHQDPTFNSVAKWNRNLRKYIQSNLEDMDDALDDMYAAPGFGAPWNSPEHKVEIPKFKDFKQASDTSKSFSKGLDNFFWQLTRLDSRHSASGISKVERDMMRGYLNELYMLTQRRGGEDNILPIPLTIHKGQIQ